MNHYEQALRDILDPIAYLTRNLEPGYELNGAAAVAMLEKPTIYQEIARKALAATPAAAPTDRLTRVGAYVIEFAKKAGWEDGDAEGAFEFIQRTSYALGLKDGAATPAAPHHDTKDAERYRFLREHGDAGCTEKDGYGGQTLRMGDCLDAAIDLLRATQGKESSNGD